jgi:hypothetical protein
MTTVHPGFKAKHTVANPRCDICNLFMSWKDARRAVAWTPYAGALQYELPDEEFAHRKCWREASERTRSRIRQVAWIPPSCMGKLA